RRPPACGRTIASRSAFVQHFPGDLDADRRGEAAAGEHAEDPSLAHRVVQPSGGGGFLRGDLTSQFLFPVDFGHGLIGEFGADALLASLASENGSGVLAVLPLSPDLAVGALLVVEQAGIIDLYEEFVDVSGHL